MVASVVSVIAVTAAALSTTRLSKLPPVADVIAALMLVASRYTSSSAATVTSTLPEVWPSAIEIVLPLSKVTVTAP